MNYYNIFIIIIIIDLIIYIIENLIFYLYAKPAYATRMNDPLIDLFPLLGISNYTGITFDNYIEKTKTLKYNSNLLINYINNEKKIIYTNQKTSIYTFGFSLIFCYICIAIYYYIVVFYLKKQIDIKQSLIVIGIVAFCVLLIEIITIFFVLKKIKGNDNLLRLKINNIALDKLKTIYNP